MADLDDYGPFDAGVGANRTEDFWRDFFRHLTGSAVIDGVTNELAVSERGAGANLSVDVATGECYVRGHWGESTSIKNLPIATADATNPRIDRVVLRLDVAANKITLEVLEGTPAGSPSAPGLTQTSATWEIPLAQVSVPALDTTIANAQITNERGFIAIDGYRFPTTTARDLYLTAPSEGDTCWVLGTYDLLYKYNGSAWVVLVARGAGSPESNVTAGIGAIYQRTDGSTGTSLYVKESGTGNTGWVAHGASASATVFTYKDANESVANSTTLQDDDELLFAVAANSVYVFTAVLRSEGDAAGDIKVTFSGPASSTGFFATVAPAEGLTGGASAGDGYWIWLDFGTAASLGVRDTSTGVGITLHGIITTAGTAGNVTLRWAQNASHATGTSVKIGSHILAHKVA